MLRIAGRTMRPQTGLHPSRRGQVAAPQSLTEKAASNFGRFLTVWNWFAFSSWPGLSRPSTSFLL